MLPLARTNPAVVSWTLNELAESDHTTAALDARAHISLATAGRDRNRATR